MREYFCLDEFAFVPAQDIQASFVDRGRLGVDAGSGDDQLLGIYQTVVQSANFTPHFKWHGQGTFGHAVQDLGCEYLGALDIGPC